MAVLRFCSGPSVPSRASADCGSSGPSVSRREWLRIGGLGGLLTGSSLSTIAARGAAAQKPSVPGFGRARSVILVYASGGQSQLEMWDPKPHAPVEIRGDFGAIPTSVPGTLLGEHLPRLAGLADRYTIIRSVTHDDLDHGSAGYLALTGHFHPVKSSNPPVRPIDMPTYGAALKRMRTGGRFPFEAVHINGPALVPETVGPGQNGGVLGAGFDPLLLGDVNSEQVAVPCLDRQIDLPAVRMSLRENLKLQLESACRDLETANRSISTSLAGFDHAYRQAYELLASPLYRNAFDLTQEPTALRDRYGRNRSGQACLLARRLVEVGVPFITVIWNHSNRGQDRSPDDINEYGWDTHNDIFDALKYRLLPRFDQGFSALLEDLEQRGLLDETLVVCMGEFGRAPQVALEKRFAGSSPGRKHWASVYSIVMAGAGVSPGKVYGSSDRMAAYPQSQAVEPGDIAATMFSSLGIDPASHYYDAFNRPYTVATGQVVRGVY